MTTVSPTAATQVIEESEPREPLNNADFQIHTELPWKLKRVVGFAHLD